MRKAGMVRYNKEYMTSMNRLPKAQKIEAVLCDFLSVQPLENKKILDYGCGSGHIASYFCERNDVTAADVVDNRDPDQRDGMGFVFIESEPLPFEEASFDIVLLNHVIVYVPERNRLMREIHRILRDGGVCYFALPNRNFPRETHSKLPFINYLPQPMFFAVFKRVMCSDQPVYLLSYRDMLQLINTAGFKHKEYTVEIIRNPEKYFAPRLPFHRYFPACLRHVSPTNVFILVKE
jgi:SAM-dependent methyltransferase